MYHTSDILFNSLFNRNHQLWGRSHTMLTYRNEIYRSVKGKERTVRKINEGRKEKRMTKARSWSLPLLLCALPLILSELCNHVQRTNRLKGFIFVCLLFLQIGYILTAVLSTTPQCLSEEMTIQRARGAL